MEQILQAIEGQMGSMKLPLVGVTLTALPCPATPLMLILHWHGFADDPDNAQLRRAPVPSTALQINSTWHNVEDIEFDALDAGWRLGAWDVAREFRRPCTRPGASSRETLECLQAFANFQPSSFDGRDLVIMEPPDAVEMLDLGARTGYLTWQFRPVRGGLFADIARDDTLAPDGTRPPPCPHLPVASRQERSARTVYRFGREPFANLGH